MSILDTTKLERQDTAVIGAKRLRRTLINAVQENENALIRIRDIVNEYGKQALIDELGSDATELATVYNHIRSLVEIVTGETIPNYDAGV